MSKLEKELYRAAVLTFEELGLLLPSPELNEEQLQAGVEGTVTVPFRGPISGRLVVTVCGGILGGLAANMLGEDDVREGEECGDALGEIGNVICGNILPRIAGTKEVFDLQPPNVSMDHHLKAIAHEERPAVTAQVGLDHGRADLYLFLDGDAATLFEEQAS
jgi:CheY-specific phosphatase CheX